MPDENMPARAGATLDNALRNDRTLNQGEKNPEGAKPDADAEQDATEEQGEELEDDEDEDSEDEDEDSDDAAADASEGTTPPAGSP